ncbi:biopolymer transport proteins [Moorella thermoacetica Y72]|uniref:Biopolymer transport proteins n=1 Tax=Moorella thermoacetica Y72 TaxID=1325331 RepID=A0A0S6UA65_NEOTH|nr:biopolymer transport proteins [Moorella thermoacetica Y72]
MEKGGGESAKGFRVGVDFGAGGAVVAGSPVVAGHRKTLAVMRDQRGFLEIYLLTLFTVAALSVFALLAGVAFGAKKNADVVYQMVGEAIDFASRAASRDTGGNLESAETLARQYFALAFARMTGTAFNGSSFVPSGASPIKAAAALEDFRYVKPGDPIPGGRASVPGFMATLKVPILVGNVPFVGPQFLDVEMRCYQPAGRVEL